MDLEDKFIDKPALAPTGLGIGSVTFLTMEKLWEDTALAFTDFFHGVMDAKDM